MSITERDLSITKSESCCGGGAVAKAYHVPVNNSTGKAGLIIDSKNASGGGGGAIDVSFQVHAM